MRYPLNRLSLLAAIPVLLGQSGRLEFQPVPALRIQERLAAVPDKLAERRAMIESLFQQSGCEGDRVTTLKVPHSAEPDVICTLSGEDSNAGVIVVGAHYDHVPTGRGAVDDWSGAALLQSLYETLKSRPPRHRFAFVAFAGEEQGMHGSGEYVHRLSKPERAEIRAMINLECLGTTPPKVWASRADKRLLAAYVTAAQALGIQAAGSNVDNVGDDDSRPFLEAKVPVLTIHSITQETFGILHSARDQVQAIHPDDYYLAYRLSAALLAYLDAQRP